MIDMKNCIAVQPMSTEHPPSEGLLRYDMRHQLQPDDTGNGNMQEMMGVALLYYRNGEWNILTSEQMEGIETFTINNPGRTVVQGDRLISTASAGTHLEIEYESGTPFASLLLPSNRYLQEAERINRDLLSIEENRQDVIEMERAALERQIRETYRQFQNGYAPDRYNLQRVQFPAYAMVTRDSIAAPEGIEPPDLPIMEISADGSSIVRRRTGMPNEPVVNVGSPVEDEPEEFDPTPPKRKRIMRLESSADKSDEDDE